MIDSFVDGLNRHECGRHTDGKASRRTGRPSVRTQRATGAAGGLNLMSPMRASPQWEVARRA